MTNPLMKRCCRDDQCVHPKGPLLPATIEFFHRNKASPDGLRTDCKECACAFRRAYNQRNKERQAEYNREYHRQHAKEIQARKRANYASDPEKERQRNREYRRQNRELCLKRSRKYMQEYRAKYPDRVREQKRCYARQNKDKINQHHRRYHKENPELVRRWRAAAAHRRRARIQSASGSHTAEDIRAQYKRQKGLCYWCGEKVGKDYHVDHIVPLARGGSNAPENLIIACPTCNQSKGAKLPHEWDGTDRLL